MKRTAFALLVILASVVRCTEPYPKVGGAWQFTSSLTYPSDFDIAPGQPYVCNHRGALRLTQSGGTFSGTYDSLSVACNTGSVSSGFSGAVISGSVTRGGAVGFYLDSPRWAAAGTLRGDSMGGAVSDSVGGLSGMEVATGLWSACLNRACR
jgi:hypothetical protein